MKTDIRAQERGSDIYRESGKNEARIAFTCEGKCRICPFPGALCAFGRENTQTSSIIIGGEQWTSKS